MAEKSIIIEWVEDEVNPWCKYGKFKDAQLMIHGKSVPRKENVLGEERHYAGSKMLWIASVNGNVVIDRDDVTEEELEQLLLEYLHE